MTSIGIYSSSSPSESSLIFTKTGSVTHLISSSDTVAIGINSMSGSEKLRVYGKVFVDGQVEAHSDRKVGSNDDAYVELADGDNASVGSVNEGKIRYSVTDQRLQLSNNGDAYESIIDGGDVSSTTEKGIIELATQTEVNTGVDTVRAITPSTLTGSTDLIHFSKSDEFTTVSSKGAPVDGDKILIEDSEASDAKKYILFGAFSTTHAIHDNVAGEIAAISNKATPAGGDLVLIEDSSAGGFSKKYSTLTQIFTALGGDVSAGSNITDHAVVRGDGGAKGVQDSGVLIDDTDNVSGLASLSFAGTVPATGLINVPSNDIVVAGKDAATNDVILFQWSGTDKIAIGDSTHCDDIYLNTAGHVYLANVAWVDSSEAYFSVPLVLDQASAPTTSTDEIGLYAGDDGSAPQLYYRPESNGTAQQITPSGAATPAGGDLVWFVDIDDSNKRKSCTFTALGTAMSWTGGASGDVTATGGNFSTDESLIRVDGAVSKNVSDTGANATCDDSGNMALAASLAVSGTGNVSTTGHVRLSKDGTIHRRRADDGADVPMVYHDGAVTMYVGHPSSTDMAGLYLDVRATGTVYMRAGGTIFAANTSDITFTPPLVLTEASAPTTAASELGLYAADDGAATQLYYRPESNGTAQQITPSGSATPTGSDEVWFVDVTDSNKRKSCTFTALGTAMSWTGGGGLGGSTGSADNAILRADGTGGSTVQAGSAVYLLDAGAIAFGSSVATAGDVRGGTSSAYAALNGAATCTVAAISSGNIYIGDTAVNGVEYCAGTGYSHTWKVNTGTEMTLSASLLTVDNPVGIGTATVPHGGVGMAKLAIEGTDSNAAGPHVQFTTSGDDYPLMQLMNFTHDNVNVVFDAYFDSSWKSSDAGSNFNIWKFTDALRFSYESGVAQGGAVTWTDGITLDTAGLVTIPTALAVGGTVAATGNIRVQNNVVTIAARNQADSADLSLLGTSTLNDVKLAYGGNGENIGLFGSPTTYDSMVGGVYLQDSTTAPSGDPNAGGYLYGQSGAVKWRGSSGTTTVLAPA